MIVERRLAVLPTLGSAKPSLALLEEARDLSEPLTIDERVGVPVDPMPGTVHLTEDLGDAEVPAMLDAFGISHELDPAPLKEGQPREGAVGAAVQVLHGPGPATPLRSDSALSLRRLDAAVAVAAHGSENRPVIGQLVVRAIAVDPRLVVETASFEQLGQDRIVGHRNIL